MDVDVGGLFRATADVPAGVQVRARNLQVQARSLHRRRVLLRVRLLLQPGVQVRARDLQLRPGGRLLRPCQGRVLRQLLGSSRSSAPERARCRPPPLSVRFLFRFLFAFCFRPLGTRKPVRPTCRGSWGGGGVCIAIAIMSWSHIPISGTHLTKLYPDKSYSVLSRGVSQWAEPPRDSRSAPFPALGEAPFNPLRPGALVCGTLCCIVEWLGLFCLSLRSTTCSMYYYIIFRGLLTRQGAGARCALAPPCPMQRETRRPGHPSAFRSHVSSPALPTAPSRQP